ncbi:MAG: hypothetical protein ACO2ZM_09460 [Francisellaceae bacterium]
MKTINYVHFYWATPENNLQLPHYTHRQNLFQWANYLKKSQFLPILWCNRMAFTLLRAEYTVNTSKPKHMSDVVDMVVDRQCHGDAFNQENIQRLPQSWHKSAEALYNLLSSDEHVFCLKARPTKRQAIIAIDIEYYFDKLSQKISELHEFLALYRLLNNQPNIQAFVKDNIMPYILCRFGGFYFDIDIQPGSVFPDNMQTLFNDDYKHMLKEMINRGHLHEAPRDHPLILKMIKFPQPNQRDHENNVYRNHGIFYDVGMLMVINPKDYYYCDREISQQLRINSQQIQQMESNGLILKSIETYNAYVANFKQGKRYSYAPNRVGINYAAIEALTGKCKKGEKGESDESYKKRNAHALKLLRKYRKNPEKSMEKLSPVCMECNDSPLKSQALNSLYIGIIQNQLGLYLKWLLPNCTWLLPHPSYYDYYKKHLFESFKQMNAFYPTSFCYTGLQRIERYKWAVDIISRHRIAKKQASTTPFLKHDEQIKPAASKSITTMDC